MTDHPAGDRLPALQGTLNFRDMGGYRAAGGKSVKWGHLYRMGSPHAITEEDVQILRTRGLVCAYDLRSSSERSSYPSRLSDLPDIEYCFHVHEALPGDLTRTTLSAETRPEQTRQMMIGLYRTLPYEFRDTYRTLFSKLADGRHPLVFNCAAGKDRTGVAAALLLSALGVSTADIFDDYLITERFFNECCRSFVERRPGSRILALEPVVWHPMLRADTDYLAAMFGQLRAAHGSTDAYLNEVLGLDEAAIAHLRMQLLEDSGKPP